MIKARRFKLNVGHHISLVRSTLCSMSNHAPEKYRVLSLFSGGMGLDLGLESTGRFRTVACIEKESAFCESCTPTNNLWL